MDFLTPNYEFFLSEIQHTHSHQVHERNDWQKCEIGYPNFRQSSQPRM